MSLTSEVQQICKVASQSGTTDLSNSVSRLKECLAKWDRKEVTLSIACGLCASWDLRPETESLEEDTPKRRIASLASELWISGALDEDTWLSTCERDLLSASESIGNLSDEKTRENRFYTREIYLQTRFNLYSESPAGFTRLQSLLRHIMNWPIAQLKHELFSLIGEMKIEPHRVLDALLEFLPEKPHPSYELLSLFDKHKVGHIMGRKFQHWKKESAKPADPDAMEEGERNGGKTPQSKPSRSGREGDSETPKDKRGPTPLRLFRLCASLEVTGYLELDVVFPYLITTKEETHQRIKEVLKALRASAHEQRFPNLNKPLPEQRSRATEKDRDVHSVYRDQKKFSYQPSRVFENVREASVYDDQYLRLAAGFLESDKPQRALRILQFLTRNDIGIEDLFCSELTKGFLSVIQRLVDPFYQRIPHSSRPLSNIIEDIKTPLFPSLRSTFASRQIFEWLIHTGYHLHQNLELFKKVAMVMIHEVRFYGNGEYSNAAFGQYPSPRRHSVEYIISTVLLPSLMLMDCKEGLEASALVEQLVQLCSYSVRVMLFIHFEEVITRSAILDRASAMAETAVRNIVKILVSSSDSESYEVNVVPVIDVLGKIAIRAPYQVTQVMIKKVQTDVMAAKDLSKSMLFFTPLAFSAFSHHFVLEIISTSGGKKHDDGHISQWYKNMLSFLGHAAHDYPDLLPLHFILQNILKEISNAEIIHVHILRQLLHSMTGFQHCSEIGNNQFATLSGGPMLKSIGLVTPWQKEEIGYDPAAIVLKKSLTYLPRNDSQSGLELTLGGQMFVLLVKFLDYVPIRGDFAQVASIMDMHSIVLGTFLAFVEFLSVYCTSQEYSDMLPSIRYMLLDMKLPMHYVAHLYRPCIVELRVVPGGMMKVPVQSNHESLNTLDRVIQQICQANSATKANSPGKQSHHQASEDVYMSIDKDNDDISKFDGMNPDHQDSLTETQLKQMIRAIDQSGIRDLNEHQRQELLSTFSFYDFVDEIQQCPEFMDKGIWDVMSPEFYAFFWGLKLNDITISDTEYRKQISQINREINTLEHESRSESHQEEELVLLKHKLESLTSERDLQQTHVKYCRNFIRERQKHLLAHVPREKLRKFVDAFVQLCLYPRIRLGHEDALFAFEFIVIMTKMGAENFPTLFILDKVVKELFPCLICMTDIEAEGFANFMYEFLRQMERWRSNKNLFDKEFGSLPGALENPYASNASGLVTHPNFLKVMAKWSNVIARLLKECLQPSESESKTTGNGGTKNNEDSKFDTVKHRKIMRRPALLVLDRLIPIFPTLTGLAKHLRAALQFVHDNDVDDGMKTAAFTALSRLNAEMESNRPGRWLELNDYNINTAKNEAPNQQETPHEFTQKELEDVIKIENEGKSDGNELGHEESKRLKKSHSKDSDLPIESAADSPEDKMNIDPKPPTIKEEKEETEKKEEEETTIGAHREEGEVEKPETRTSDPNPNEERRVRRQVENKRTSEDDSTRPTGVKKPRRTLSQRSAVDETQKNIRPIEEQHGGRLLPRVNEGGTNAHNTNDSVPRRVSSREDSKKKKDSSDRADNEKDQQRRLKGTRRDDSRRKEAMNTDRRS